METKLIIKTKSLKDFLSLFNQDKVMDNLSLGDTWHPASGFVDEGILNGKRKIKEVIDLDYDFNGLIGFTANIENMKLRLLSDTTDSSDGSKFEVKGPIKDMRILNNKILEKKAYCPRRYEVDFIMDYEK